MKFNMGGADRVIRVIVAIVFAVLYFTGTIHGTLGIVLLIVAILFALTAVVGVCPTYLPFGLSTMRAPSAPAPVVPERPEAPAPPPSEPPTAGPSES